MIMEIRTYALRPGRGAAFAALLGGAAGDLLRDFGLDVVRHGPSLDDPDRYVLVRAFADAAEREEQESRFYRSEEWRTGPRTAVLDAIDTYHEIVLDVPTAAVEALRA